MEGGRESNMGGLVLHPTNDNVIISNTNYKPHH